MENPPEETSIKDDLKTLLYCAFILSIIFLPMADFLSATSLISNLLSPDLTGYPYLNPPVFLSIGEALASIAILLAVYQFRKEKWHIALRVRSYIEPVVFSSIGIGVLLAIVSSLVFIKNPTSVVQISVFWQVLAALFIAFSIAFLLLKATNKKLFNKSNAKRFYEILAWELSRPTPERLNVILAALLENFENICKVASQNHTTEEGQYAVAILDVVLGEGSLIEELTTKRLDALHYIFFVVEKYELHQRQAVGIARIVRNLFADQDSFLYKQLEMSGLALSSNLYELVFGSSVILSNFDLFGWPTLDYTLQKDNSSTQINVFIKALSKGIETYLKTGSVPPRHINNGLAHLSEIFEDLCLKISTEESRGVDTKYALKDQWWSLHIIASFLGHDYPFLAYKDTFNADVIEQEKTASEANFYSDSTINEGVAAILYKSFEHLTYIKNTDDTYQIVLQLLQGMTYDEQYKEGYRSPFEKRIWEQIGNNVVKKYYPAALRTYLTFLGFSVASKKVGEGKGWIGEQTERVRRLLYLDLKPLFYAQAKMVNDEKMEDALLPDAMKYKDSKFTYTMGFGKGPTVEIEEPPAGSASALEGVDLESPRSLL